MHASLGHWDAETPGSDWEKEDVFIWSMYNDFAHSKLI